MQFEILGEISAIETFARGSGIRELARLRRVYGHGRWRKRKGSLRFGYPMALSTSLKYTGTKRPASVARNSRSNTCFEKTPAMARPRAKRLVVCIDNDGYGASLESRKIYVALPDAGAEKHGLVRIIDESGDDYLYPGNTVPSRRTPAGYQKGDPGRGLRRTPSMEAS
jgi:hypothetical protein